MVMMSVSDNCSLQVGADDFYKIREQSIRYNIFFPSISRIYCTVQQAYLGSRHNDMPHLLDEGDGLLGLVEFLQDDHGHQDQGQRVDSADHVSKY